jgi:hypothetical protein
MRWTVRRVVPVVIAAFALAAIPTEASTPPSHAVTVPPSGSTTTVTWTGTIPPGTNPTSSCDVLPGDSHEIQLQVPAGLYDSATAEATFKIRWTDPDQDEILTVRGPGDSSGSSDGSSNSEMVLLNDPKAGTYTVEACPFLATAPQDYTGELTIRSSARGAGEASLPAADAQGLAFSPSVPADPQRDESEPEIRVDDDGNAVSCGPTGFSNAAEYAQISMDGGDQFHLIGEEPRGQQGSGGGGDCGLAFGVRRNSQNKFQYAYTGLGPLTGFTTSTSPDNGHRITTGGPQGNGNTAKGGLADRQWMAFLDDDTVLLSYNQQVPRNIVVQRSDNGGLTYNDLDPAHPADRQGVIASASPDFPGPMHSLPARLVYPGAGADEYVAYYGWNASGSEGADDFSYVNFAISEPGSDGLVWHNCRVARIPADDGGLGAFTVADNDREGNMYLTYADTKAYHSYLTTLTADKVRNCTGANTDTSDALTNPGWSAPVQVDRGNVRSTVFPWLAANGEPGRVAIAFYGTESDGDPNTGAFKASWDVYVNQSLNALDASPAISQVKATTHPFHYDSICLNGLGCDLAAPPGDRSLADFFAIDYNPKTRKLMVVYDQSAKQPDEASGRIATPAVVTQTAGPSNGGGAVEPDTRPVVRAESADPAGDATADYSNTSVGVPPPAPASINTPAMDFRSQAVGPEVDPATGAGVADGGFTVTLRLADLSDGALNDALQKTKSGSLLWIFRFVNGYTASAASARWSPLQASRSATTTTPCARRSAAPRATSARCIRATSR